jgi:hypothetical protein
MTLDFPELMYDNYFHSVIKVLYHSNEYFEEWRYLQNLQKRSEIASALMGNLVITMPDGTQKPFLTMGFIARRIMKFTEADLAENARYDLMNPNSAAPGEGGGGGGGAQPIGGGGAQPGGGPESLPEGGAQGGPESPPAPEGGAQGGAQPTF